MDELQLDCPSSVFDIHKFDNEDEAKAFCKANNDSGAPSHVGDEYWCCPDNIVSDVILDSIYQVQTQLKLRVDLGIEWQIGTNWANCH